jgi:hypothetical protein
MGVYRARVSQTIFHMAASANVVVVSNFWAASTLAVCAGLPGKSENMTVRMNVGQGPSAAHTMLQGDTKRK